MRQHVPVTNITVTQVMKISYEIKTIVRNSSGNRTSNIFTLLQSALNKAQQNDAWSATLTEELITFHSRQQNLLLYQK